MKDSSTHSRLSEGHHFPLPHTVPFFHRQTRFIPSSTNTNFTRHALHTAPHHRLFVHVLVVTHDRSSGFDMLVMRSIFVAQNLLSLLGSSLLSGITVDVSQIRSLLNSALDSVPTLANSWRQVLAVGNGVTASCQVVDSLLDKGALRKSSPYEHSVDDDEDPGALLEEEGRTKQTEPESNLKDSNKSHGAVVVVLDKVTNGVSESR